MILGEKQSLRVQARRFLARLDAGLKQTASRKILDQLEGWEPWRAARTVCAFSALSCEPDLLTPWPLEKKIILPRVAGSTLNLHFVEHAGELVVGSFGVFEPSEHAPVAEAKADLILVPGLAFDRSGMRLGRGGGYYDRFLVGFEGLRVGICFQEVVFDRIPFEPHDAVVDFLATPEGIISCEPRNRLSDQGG
jgi:5-formyltetrahydrofolate cyclo-ligase